ncbi:MAG: hypothetical protein WA174_09980 [Rhodoferax sp.]
MTATLESSLRARYDALQAQAAPGTAITVLELGAQHTGVASGSGPVAVATRNLAIGAQRTAHTFFKRALPTPLELETAIATVEDEVTRVRAILAPDSRLYTADAAVREIALLAGVPPAATMHLTLEAVEQTFNRLAALSEGRPATQDALPPTAAFAATLLILREFMHHLQFAAITVVA